VLTPDAKLFIAIIGCVTLTMAALIAVVQSDIKKVLAYSTLSQLGYMIMAIGIGSWVGGLFHLITHAFFKALLFLGSGSVIHAAHHEQELPQYGGLIRKIPVTGITFGIAVLAISGFGISIAGHDFGLSGFYSKDMIIAHAGAFATLASERGHGWGFSLLFWLPAVVAYVTAFYMTRCWMLTFAGKPRNQHLYDHAHETPVLYVPLIILAIMSVIAGYPNFTGIRELVVNATSEASMIADRPDVFAQMWPSEEPVHEGGGDVDVEPSAEHAAETVEHAFTQVHDPLTEGWHMVHAYVYWAFLVGIGLGVLVYWNGYTVVNGMMKVPGARMVHTWLYRRMYFDELYNAVFVGITMALSRLSAWFDKYVVDGIVNLAGLGVKCLSGLIGLNDKYVVDGAVNGAGKLAYGLGAAVRAPQSAGRIRMYVTVLMIAVAVGLAGAIFVVLSS
jgi:NADH-quinone oxidoreductase subunit L